ncbi:MAG: hypothetical protein GF308_12610 [Candidatus Heimdallarchaeota archaeon]|nr:hypothetical protein [Candidatus Heimdallarchaeota archaeon]
MTEEQDTIIKKYIQELQAEEQEKRIQAAIALGEIGDEQVVTPLINALSHQDADTRREAARALKEIGNERAVSPLIAVLKKEPSLEVRAEIIYDLAYFSKAEKTAFDLLIKQLEDDHYLIRQNAIFALGRISRRKGVRYLIQALQTDTNYNVREMAAWALGEINDKRTVDPLISALNDDHIAVRKKAAYALGVKEITEAENKLKELLFTEREPTEIAWALTKILKKKEAIRILGRAFRRKKRENRPRDCFAIGHMLFQLAPKIGKELLQDLLDEEDFAAIHAEIKELFL